MFAFIPDSDQRLGSWVKSADLPLKTAIDGVKKHIDALSCADNNTTDSDVDVVQKKKQTNYRNEHTIERSQLLSNTSQLLSALTSAHEDEEGNDVVDVYWNTLTGEVTLIPPREFGGVDWAEWKTDMGVIYVNRFTWERTRDPSVLARPAVPSYIAEIEERVERRRVLTRREKAEKDMKETVKVIYTKYGLDPVMGRPLKARKVTTVTLR